MQTRISIKAVGEFFKKDEQGYLINPCSLAHLSASEHKMLNFCYSWCQQTLGPSLHSLWLRGSMARANAKNEYADLDLFALVKDQQLKHWTPIPHETDLQTLLHDQFGIKDVECMISGLYEDGLPHPRMQMMLVTQSMLIGGIDIVPRLPKYRVDSSLLLNFRWLKLDFAEWKNGKMDDDREHSFIKAIIRTAREITQERSGRYSPDLFYCCSEFSRFYPQQSTHIWQLLWHFLHPHSAKAKARSCVHRILPFLLKEIEAMSLC